MAKPKHSPKRERSGGAYWMYGTHACEAAMQNPEREIRKVLITKAANAYFQMQTQKLPWEEVEPERLHRLLPEGAVHQGIACEVTPLDAGHWMPNASENPLILMLDQVTDPHNVGAMLRTAAAFGVSAVLVPKDHAPPETAVMAKAACGALDLVPMVRVTNLAHSMKELKAEGYWVAGLDGEAKNSVSKLKDYKPLCVVMGAEGKGMRRLTAEGCDVLVAIPIQPLMESLNVSNAAAIALYAATAV